MPGLTPLRHRFQLFAYDGELEKSVSEWIDALPPEYVVPLDGIRFVPESENFRPAIFVIAHHVRARSDVHEAEVFGMANKQAIALRMQGGVQVAQANPR